MTERQSIDTNGLGEIRDRLAAYEEPETTKELYDFGKMLLQEAVDRAHWLDSKAGILVGFSGAILALLFSTLPNWKGALDSLPDTFRAVVFVAIFCLLLTSLSALLALSVQKYEWLDENKVWLAPEYLNFPDLLERYHLIAMYRSIASHSKKADRKSNFLIAAQWMLVAGGVLLSSTLLAIVWLALRV